MTHRGLISLLVLVLVAVAGVARAQQDSRASDITSTYYAFQGSQPTEEQRTDGALAVQQLLDQGYTLADLNSAVVRIHQEIAGAKTAALQDILPVFVQTNYVPAGAAPPPPTPAPPADPEPAPQADEEEDQDWEDRERNVARSVSKGFLAAGIPLFASGYIVSVIGGIAIPPAFGVQLGGIPALGFIPFVGIAAVYGIAGDLTGAHGESGYERWSGFVGAMCGLQVAGFTCMMVAAGLHRQAMASRDVPSSGGRLALRLPIPTATVSRESTQFALTWRF
jgi:hypothetical protein